MDYLRIYLTGRIGIERREQLVVEERQFRGRQARLAFSYLVLERSRPVPRWELAALIWPEETPPAWEGALSALVSRIRSLLASIPLPDRPASVSGGFGQYQLELPAASWVDLSAADSAIDEAEGALRAGDFKRAFGPATVAATIARRPFLSGEQGEWVELQRRKLQRQLQRGLECLAQVWLHSGEPELAVNAASEAVQLDTCRESGYQLLMRSHAAAGNRAEGMRAYHRLRSLLAEELGANPSAETERLYSEMLT